MTNRSPGDTPISNVPLALAGLSTSVAFDWLPGHPCVAFEASADRIDVRTRAGLRLSLQRQEEGPATIWRGRLDGLPDAPPAPVPADSALSRDYKAGGLCVARASAVLPPADAYQRPRWSAAGWTVELLPLDARIVAARPAADAAPDSRIEVLLYPPHRNRAAGVPVAFALLAAPSEAFAQAWRALAAREGLPGPHSPADREKVLRVARRPTLFSLNPTNHLNGPRLIDWAASAGFGSILLHSPVWTRSDSTYEPNTDNWPGGWPMLKAFVDQARDRGLAVGLHTLTTSIADHDPYVTPIPDARLLVAWSTCLAQDVSATDTTLSLADPPVGLSARDDYMSFGKTVRIDNELFSYGTAAESERALRSCRRGAFGTTAASHSRGARVDYLFRLYGEFALDPESSLAAEVAARIARAFHETGAEMIYFDDSEAMPDPYLGHVSRFHERVWRAVGLGHLHVQASSTGPYGMFLLARIGQQDTTIYKRVLLDRVIMPNVARYQAADLVPDFGWFGIVFGDLDRDATTNDDIDCLMARVTGSQSGVTVFGHPELTGTMLFQKVARRMALWEAARQGHLSAADRAALASPGREFRPASKSGQVRANESLPARTRLVADECGSAQFDIENPGPLQPLALHLTLRPPLEPRGGPRSLILFQPGRDAVAGVSGAVADTPACAGGRAILPWRVHDRTQDYARWRIVLPAPLDLSNHRALSLRYRVDGTCRAAVARLITGIGSWVTGVEYVIPVEARVELAADDPPVDPAVHLQHRWPDDWFSFTQGIALQRVEAVEFVAVGLEESGQVSLDAIEALHESRSPGPCVLHIESGARTFLRQALPLDGSVDLVPAEEGTRAEISERSGAHAWQWQYGVAEAPVLVPGHSRLRFSGLPPAARADVRVDRIMTDHKD